MTENKNAASFPSENDAKIAKRARFVDCAKDAMKSGLYGILLAGTLGAVALGSIKILESEKTHRDVVQPIISEACVPTGSSNGGNRLAGLPAELAAGMLLKHSKEIQQICAAINAAIEPKHGMDNFGAKYMQVYALANVLNVTRQVAAAAIAQEESERAGKALKAGIEKTYANPDFSSR